MGSCVCLDSCSFLADSFPVAEVKSTIEGVLFAKLFYRLPMNVFFFGRERRLLLLLMLGRPGLTIYYICVYLLLRLTLLDYRFRALPAF